MSHSVREFNSEYLHRLAEHGGQRGDEHETHLQQLPVGLTQNRGVVVVLVELLGELIAVVCDQGGRKCIRRLGDLLRISRNQLDQTHFLGAQGNSVLQRHADALFVRLAQNRHDAGVCILDERAGVAVEIDGLLGVEEHFLLGIDLQDEILQRPEPYRMIEPVLFLLREFSQLSALVRSGLRLLVHLLDKVVGVHHGPLPGLHLALRQFDHSV